MQRSPMQRRSGIPAAFTAWHLGMRRLIQSGRDAASTLPVLVVVLVSSFAAAGSGVSRGEFGRAIGLDRSRLAVQAGRDAQR